MAISDAHNNIIESPKTANDPEVISWVRDTARRLQDPSLVTDDVYQLLRKMYNYGLTPTEVDQYLQPIKQDILDYLTKGFSNRFVISCLMTIKLLVRLDGFKTELLELLQLNRVNVIKALLYYIKDNAPAIVSKAITQLQDYGIDWPELATIYNSAQKIQADTKDGFIDEADFSNLGKTVDYSKAFPTPFTIDNALDLYGWMRSFGAGSQQQKIIMNEHKPKILAAIRDAMQWNSNRGNLWWKIWSVADYLNGRLQLYWPDLTDLFIANLDKLAWYIARDDQPQDYIAELPRIAGIQPAEQQLLRQKIKQLLTSEIKEVLSQEGFTRWALQAIDKLAQLGYKIDLGPKNKVRLLQDIQRSINTDKYSIDRFQTLLKFAYRTYDKPTIKQEIKQLLETEKTDIIKWCLMHVKYDIEYKSLHSVKVLSVLDTFDLNWPELDVMKQSMQKIMSGAVMEADRPDSKSINKLLNKTNLNPYMVGAYKYGLSYAIDALKQRGYWDSDIVQRLEKLDDNLAVWIDTMIDRYSAGILDELLHFVNFLAHSGVKPIQLPATLAIINKYNPLIIKGLLTKIDIGLTHYQLAGRTTAELVADEANDLQALGFKWPELEVIKKSMLSVKHVQEDDSDDQSKPLSREAAVQRQFDRYCRNLKSTLLDETNTYWHYDLIVTLEDIGLHSQQPTEQQVDDLQDLLNQKKRKVLFALLYEFKHGLHPTLAQVRIEALKKFGITWPELDIITKSAIADQYLDEDDADLPEHAWPIKQAISRFNERLRSGNIYALNDWTEFKTIYHLPNEEIRSILADEAFYINEWFVKCITKKDLATSPRISVLLQFTTLIKFGVDDPRFLASLNANKPLVMKSLLSRYKEVLDGTSALGQEQLDIIVPRLAAYTGWPELAIIASSMNIKVEHE